MSLMASCKLNEVEPWAYLKDILTRLPSLPSGADLDAFLPDLWLASNPAHRWTIASRRKQERLAIHSPVLPRAHTYETFSLMVPSFHQFSTEPVRNRFASFSAVPAVEAYFRAPIA